MLHLDWNLLWNIINLIILYLLMKHFLIGPVTAIMDKRKAEIEGQYEQAGQAEKQAGALKTEYEEKIKTADQESARIIDQAREMARGEYDRILKDANLRAGKVMGEAKGAIELEREKMLREAQGGVVSLVMAATGKIIGEQNRDSIDFDLYTEFLNKAGDDHDAAVH